MLRLCADVEANLNVKERCKYTFEAIVKWYQKMQGEYSSSMCREMSTDIAYFEEKWGAEISKSTEDLRFDLNYQFSTKLSFFSVSDALQKILLCRYSFGPNAPFRNKYGIDNAVTKNDTVSWLDQTINDVLVIEIIARVLEIESEKPEFDLTILHEARNVRSKGTHTADFEKCLTTLQCYNIIRSLILFLDPEIELAKFDYPPNDRFDIDEFKSRSNFTFDDYTTILFVDPVHSIPVQLQEKVANYSWSIVVDSDGYSFKYGLASHLQHTNLNHQLVTDAASIPGLSGMPDRITYWFRLGDCQIRDLSKVRNRNQNVSPIDGYHHYCDHINNISMQHTNIIREIIRFAYQFDRPLNIVVLSNDSEFVSHIVQQCINWDPTELPFFCTWIGLGENPARFVFDPYDKETNNALEYDHFAHFNCSYAHFFKEVSAHEQSLGWKSRYSAVSMFLLPTEKMPKGKPVMENDRVLLQKYCDVLYLGAEYQDADIKADTENFYRGSKAAWSVIGSKEAPLLSDKVADFITDIKSAIGFQQSLVDKQIFFVKHTAGQGGTTLARQIAWELHFQYPVLELRNKPGNDFVSIIQNFYDQVVDASPFIILCDDGDANLPELIQNYLPYIKRRFCLLVAAREKNALLKSYPKATNLTFSTFADDKLQVLRSKFHKNSCLDEELLKKKDEEFQTALIEKNPFFIGLYYNEADFDIVNYVKKTFQNAPNNEYRKALACIAMCDVMGQKNVPVRLVHAIARIPVISHDDIFKQYQDANSLVLRERGASLYYSFKHIRLAEQYLRLYTTVNNSDTYYQLGIAMIDAAALLCRREPPVAVLDLLKYVIIQNKEEAENGGNVRMSKYLNSLGTPEQVISILQQLGDSFRTFAEQYLAEKEQAANTDKRSVIQLVSHAYAHLGRQYAKGVKPNFDRAVEYLSLARSFMLGNDPDIYHMEGLAWHEKLKKTIRYQKDYPELCNDDELLEIFRQIITLYDNTTIYGSPEYGIPKKMELCMDVLRYLFEKKEIHSVKDFYKLSPEQQEIYTFFVDTFSEAERYSIEEYPTAADMVSRSRDYLQSGQLFGNHGDVVAFFQERYDQCDRIRDSYNTNRCLLNLTYAQLRNYRAKYETPAFHRYLDRNRALTLQEHIAQLLAAEYNKESVIDYFRRTKLYHEWFLLAKAMSIPVIDCLQQAQAWLAMEKEYTAQKRCRKNPEPWYYMMVLHYIDALEGTSTAIHEALNYQKELNNEALFEEHQLQYHVRFRDLVVDGKGAGRLMDTQYCQYEEDILRESVALGLTPMVVAGGFNPVQSGYGEIELYLPKHWSTVDVHVRYGKSYRNTLNQGLQEHKVECLIGFTMSKPHALSQYVKDLQSEKLDLSAITMEFRRELNKAHKSGTNHAQKQKKKKEKKNKR